MDSNTFYSSTRSPYYHPIHPSFQCDNCGKTYTSPRHLDQHQRQCQRSKRTLSDLLEETKEFWQSRKRRRTGAGRDDPVYMNEHPDESPPGADGTCKKTTRFYNEVKSSQSSFSTIRAQCPSGYPRLTTILSLRDAWPKAANM